MNATVDPTTAPDVPAALARIVRSLQMGGRDAFLLALFDHDGAGTLSALVQHVQASASVASVDLAGAEDLLSAIEQARVHAPDAVLVLHGLEGSPNRDAFLRRSVFRRDAIGNGNGPAVWLVPQELYAWIGANTPDLLRWPGAPFDLRGMEAERPAVRIGPLREIYLGAMHALAGARPDETVAWPARETARQSVLHELDGSAACVSVLGPRGVGTTHFLGSIVEGLASRGEAALFVPFDSDSWGIEEPDAVLASMFSGVVRELEREDPSWESSRRALSEGRGGRDVLRRIAALNRVLVVDRQWSPRKEDLVERLTKVFRRVVIAVPYGPPRPGLTINLTPIAPRHRDGRLWAENLTLLAAIAERSCPACRILGEDTIRRLCVASGGLPKTVFRILLLMVVKAGPPTVSFGEALDAAVREMIQMFTDAGRGLDLLREVRRTQRFPDDPRALSMLDDGLILQYSNGTTWFDAHPLALPYPTP